MQQPEQQVLLPARLQVKAFSTVARKPGLSLATDTKFLEVLGHPARVTDGSSSNKAGAIPVTCGDHGREATSLSATAYVAVTTVSTSVFYL